METNVPGNGKKKPKGPIKFNIQLNEEQKMAKAQILENVITVLHGKTGSGKTFLAVQVALDLLFNREIDKIVITRPTVSKEDIGFLPGDMYDKMEPWVAPIYANMHLLYDKDKINKLFDDDRIEIVPVSFMRGRTFLNSCVIIDEFQNVDFHQLKMIMGRLGNHSKMILCGDSDQIDIKDYKTSGYYFVDGIDKIKNICSIKLQTNNRHPILDDLFPFFEEKMRKRDQEAKK